MLYPNQPWTKIHILTINQWPKHRQALTRAEDNKNHLGLEAKTYWLTDCQSQCDFDFDFDQTVQWVPDKETGMKL
jgi:hypothetical protein